MRPVSFPGATLIVMRVVSWAASGAPIIRPMAPSAANRYTPAVMAQLSEVRRPFRALANVFIPETAGADEAAWSRLEAIVAGALASRPSAIARQVLLFIRILDALSVMRYGRGLASLDPSRRTRLVEGIATSRVL